VYRLGQITLVAVVVVSLFLLRTAPASPAQSPAPKRVYILDPTHSVVVQPGGKIHLRLKITELQMAPNEMGRPNVPAEGHYHFYVDCIPPNAYYVANLAGCWAGASASLNAVFDLSTSHVKVESGTHVLLVALARNDHILYRVPPAALVFTVVNSPNVTGMGIRILNPLRPVTVAPNGKISLSLGTTGITFAPNEMGQANVPGHGHYHFYVDCIPSDAYTRPDLSTCWAGASALMRTSFDLSVSHVKVGPGQHKLILALAQNDHVLYPARTATLLFTVGRAAAGGMSVRILSPSGPVVVRQNGRIRVSLQINGLKLAPNELGRANVPGHGHYHFYVDCIPPDAYTKPDLSTCWAGAAATPTSVLDLPSSHVKISPGRHRLIIALAHNDHVLYRAPTSELAFTVTK